MEKEQKLVIEACILTLRNTLGHMSSSEADKNVSAVVQILESMVNLQIK